MTIPDDWVDIGLLMGRLAILPMFVASIWDKIVAPPEEVTQIRSLGLPYAAVLERLAGLFEAICVAAIASGIGARFGAAGLALFTLFITIALLQFWKLPPGEATTLKRTLFFNNLSAVGGLLLIITLGPGRLVL